MGRGKGVARVLLVRSIAIAIIDLSKKMKLLLICGALLATALADKTTTSDLLWPQPFTMEFGSHVYAIDSSFSFLGASNSDILKGAFTRYQQLIFDTPTPFYPSGGSAAVTGILLTLVVTLTSDDETLGLKTDESCQ